MTTAEYITSAKNKIFAAEASLETASKCESPSARFKLQKTAARDLADAQQEIFNGRSTLDKEILSEC